MRTSWVVTVEPIEGRDQQLGQEPTLEIWPIEDDVPSDRHDVRVTLVLLDETRDPVRWDHGVGIRQRDEIASGRSEPANEGTAVVALGLVNDGDAWAARDTGRAVRARVVDHHDLDGIGIVLGEERIQATRKP